MAQLIRLFKSQYRNTTKRIIIFISCACMFQTTHAAVSREEVIKKSVSAGESFWQRAQSPNTYEIALRDVFYYALALCESGEHLNDRLPKLLDMMENAQDKDPTSATFGNFKWSYSDSAVTDKNAADFCMSPGVGILTQHLNKFSSENQTRYKTIVDRAVTSCFNYHVSDIYTNIRIVNASNLILLGEALDRPEIAAAGYEKLNWFYLYTIQCGLREYTSPSYYGVDYEGLGAIYSHTTSDKAKMQANALLEYLWTDIAANWFDPAKRISGARSRQVGDFMQGVGALDVYLWYKGLLYTEPILYVQCIMASQFDWEIPESIKNLRLSYPRYVKQKWGYSHRETRTSYIMSDIALGTAAAPYSGQEVNLAVDFTGGYRSARMVFVPDGYGDPFMLQEWPNNSSYHHFQAWVTTAQRSTDALLCAIYNDSEVSTLNSLHSHLLIPRTVEIFVNERSMLNKMRCNESVSLTTRDCVFLRRGSAVAGIYVPLAVDCAGNKIDSMQLVFDDGNVNGVRLTIDHHLQTQSKAQVAFHVRIATGINTDDELRNWISAFSSAVRTTITNEEQTKISVAGLEGEVAIDVSLPLRTPVFLTPQPSRSLLEVNGTDIGFPILRATEPGSNYEDLYKPFSPIDITNAAQGIYWEAEYGYPFPLTKPITEGGRTFLTMPLDGQGGTPHIMPTGGLYYKLNVPESGQYYLWGLVNTDAAKRDALVLQTTAGADAQEYIPFSYWSCPSTASTWKWAKIEPTLLDGTKTYFYFPKGTNNLYLGVKRFNIKVDRLFITSDPNVTPQ